MKIDPIKYSVALKYSADLVDTTEPHHRHFLEQIPHDSEGDWDSYTPHLRYSDWLRSVDKPTHAEVIRRAVQSPDWRQGFHSTTDRAPFADSHFAITLSPANSTGTRALILSSQHPVLHIGEANRLESEDTGADLRPALRHVWRLLELPDQEALSLHRNLLKEGAVDSST